MRASFVAALLLVSSAARADDEDTRAPAEAKAVAFDRHWVEPYFQSGPARAAIERFRIDDWAGAADGLTRALPVLAKNAPERQPARFLLAIARMNLQQWEAAGQIFEELHASYPLLAPWHAYYAARCRVRRGDAVGALVWAGRVPERTVPEAEAVLVKIDALVALQRPADVEREAASFLERFAGGPRRAEASFRRAEALEAIGRSAEAIPLYRKIWAEAPTETWAAKATARLDALEQRTHTAAEWVARGMVFFERNANTESEAAFTAALAAPGLDPALACKAKYHRAQSVWKQRQRPRAAPLFAEAETACRESAEKDLTVKCMYQQARCRASTGDRAGAQALYARIETEAPDHSYADDARLRAAEVATDAGDDAGAAALLQEIPVRYPRGDLAGEALWRLAFRAFRAGRWDEARARLDENLRLIPHEEVWYAEGRALYWKGRVFEKQNARGEAKASYEQAVREYPLSVYALLSLERLRRAFPQERATLVRDLRRELAAAARAKPATPTVTWDFRPQPIYGEPGFRRAVELARMGLGGDARRELAKLGLAVAESRDAARKAPGNGDGRDDAYWIAAILLDRGRLWSASHAIPRYTVTSYRLAYPAGRGADEWRIAYPRAFPELVTRNCRANQVPEALQLAIMREESAFNPRIESWANALGLTQMLVRTAQRFAAGQVTREALLDPAKNLEVGSRFLSFLLQRYSGAVPLAIAGYNAGEAAVDRWLKERSNWELDEFLESIPYDETRNYTKRVLASFAAYNWLYQSERPVPELSFRLTQPQPSRAGRTAPALAHRRPARRR